jgi:hypothetical protein
MMGKHQHNKGGWIVHQSRAVVRTQRTKFRREEEVDHNEFSCDEFDDDIDIKAIRTSKDVLDREEQEYS